MRVVRRENMRAGGFDREIGSPDANTPEVARRAKVGNTALAYEPCEMVVRVTGSGGGLCETEDLPFVLLECRLNLLYRELDSACG